jgi:cysteine desulfurase
MGLSEKEAFGSVRFSLGRFNTREEIELVIAAVGQEVRRLRGME